MIDWRLRVFWTLPCSYQAETASPFKVRPPSGPSRSVKHRRYCAFARPHFSPMSADVPLSKYRFYSHFSLVFFQQLHGETTCQESWASWAILAGVIMSSPFHYIHFRTYSCLLATRVSSPPPRPCSPSHSLSLIYIKTPSLQQFYMP
jgi:hypothetical protein